MASLIAIGAARLQTRLPSIDQVAAGRVMQEVADELCERFARSEVYIQASCAEKRAVRDAEIRAMYSRDGADPYIKAGTPARAAELARQHRLSVRRIRTILAASQTSPNPPPLNRGVSSQ